MMVDPGINTHGKINMGLNLHTHIHICTTDPVSMLCCIDSLLEKLL